MPLREVPRFCAAGVGLAAWWPGTALTLVFAFASRRFTRSFCLAFAFVRLRRGCPISFRFSLAFGFLAFAFGQGRVLTMPPWTMLPLLQMRALAVKPIVIAFTARDILQTFASACGFALRRCGLAFALLLKVVAHLLLPLVFKELLNHLVEYLVTLGVMEHFDLGPIPSDHVLKLLRFTKLLEK